MADIKVLIADDHPIFREGLARLFRDGGGLDCVGVAEDGEEAIKLARELKPDVIIMDVQMPKINGVDAALQIKKASPDTAILILSAYKYNDYIIAAMQAGVDGYLLKDTPRDELMEAVRMIHSGKGVFNLEATGEILRRISAAPGAGLHPAGLGRRELEVLKLAAKGMSNKQIAHALSIAENTVGTHLVSIFKKLGVESRTEAALYALKEGLITINDIAEK